MGTSGKRSHFLLVVDDGLLRIMFRKWKRATARPFFYRDPKIEFENFTRHADIARSQLTNMIGSSQPVNMQVIFFVIRSFGLLLIRHSHRKLYLVSPSIPHQNISSDRAWTPFALPSPPKVKRITKTRLGLTGSSTLLKVLNETSFVESTLGVTGPSSSFWGTAPKRTSIFCGLILRQLWKQLWSRNK